MRVISNGICLLTIALRMGNLELGQHVFSFHRCLPEFSELILDITINAATFSTFPLPLKNSELCVGGNKWIHSNETTKKDRSWAFKCEFNVNVGFSLYRLQNPYQQSCFSGSHCIWCSVRVYDSPLPLAMTWRETFMYLLLLVTHPRWFSDDSFQLLSTFYW